MDANTVNTLVERYYNLKPVEIEKIKNVYRIVSPEGSFCLKVVRYEKSRFIFVLKAVKHLYSQGFKGVPPVIKTKDMEDYIPFEDYYAYLTPWVMSRECSYSNPVDIYLATVTLAELHKKSKGFQIDKGMKPQIGWLHWIDNFSKKKEDLLFFRSIVNQKSKLSEFDDIYLKVFDEEIVRCDSSIDGLVASDYFRIMSDEITGCGFCHHDYAHHNILIDSSGEVSIIDFDYIILDSRLHDISSLLIRRMKYGHWDISNAEAILQSYSSISPISNYEIPIMAAFMEFPQDYWQVGIQYYKEKQPWGEDFFIRKLNRILEDREEKQEFIEEFRSSIIKGI